MAAAAAALEPAPPQGAAAAAAAAAAGAAMRRPSDSESGATVVDVLRDAAYNTGDAAHEKHKLDLFFPPACLRVRGVAPQLVTHNARYWSYDEARPAAERAPQLRAALPVVMFVHGGGWKKGDRQYYLGLYGNVGKALARQGFVTAVISYRLSWFNPGFQTLLTAVYSALLTLVSLAFVRSTLITPLVFTCAFATFMALAALLRPRNPIKHPGHVEDCALALQWLRQNIGALGGDATRVFLVGHSAGGHLVSLLALDSRFLRARGFSDADLACIRGVVSVSGVLSFERIAANCIAHPVYLHPAFGSDRQRWREAFPLSHVRPDAPPFLVLNAEREFAGLARHSEDFVHECRRVGARVAHATVPRTNHFTIINNFAMPQQRQQLLGAHAGPLSDDPAAAAAAATVAAASADKDDGGALQHVDDVTRLSVQFMRQVLREAGADAAERVH